MLKKSLVLFICLLSSLSISYMYSKDDNHNLSASTNSYIAGGTVTGRVNKAPANLSVNQVEFQKGDRVLLGTMNPEYNEPISLQLIEKAIYTSYNCPVYDSTCTQLQSITSWLTLTTKTLRQTTTAITTSD